jgi:hypothetical protein
VPPRFTDREAGLTDSEKSAGTLVTVRLAVPVLPPPAADTMKVPAVAPAVTCPEELIVLSPVTDQVKVGCGLNG